VEPYWTGESAKESAIDYAKARATFGRGDIRVVRQDGSVESVKCHKHLGQLSGNAVARQAHSRAPG
jgi:hypothetical protein